MDHTGYINFHFYDINMYAFSYEIFSTCFFFIPPANQTQPENIFAASYMLYMVLFFYVIADLFYSRFFRIYVGISIFIPALCVLSLHQWLARVKEQQRVREQKAFYYFFSSADNRGIFFYICWKVDVIL